MGFCTRITVIAGLAVIVMGCARGKLMSSHNTTPVQPSPVIAPTPEGKPMVITGGVYSLEAESKGRILVGISPFARFFYITRSDPNFEKWLALLKEAVERKQYVKCTVREYSGRIEQVVLES